MSETRQRPMPWFRQYSELLRDPAFEALPAADVKHLIKLWCLANETEPRGSLPAADAVAFHLRVSIGKAAAVLNKLRELGFLATDQELGRLVIADRRMYREADNVTRRVATWRATKDDLQRYNQRYNQQDGNVTSNAHVTLASNSPSASASSGAEGALDRAFEESLDPDRLDETPITEAEEEDAKRYMQRYIGDEESPVDRAKRHLRESGIAGGQTPQFEQMLAESGIDCVLHCIDEAVLHNKLSLAYVEQIRRRHELEGCPSDELSTRLERATGRRRY